MATELSVMVMVDVADTVFVETDVGNGPADVVSAAEEPPVESSMEAAATLLNFIAGPKHSLLKACPCVQFAFGDATKSDFVKLGHVSGTHVRKTWSYIRSSVDAALKVRIHSRSGVPENEESQAILSTSVLASPLHKTPIGNLWAVQVWSASNHSVIGKVLRREIIGDARGCGCLSIAEEFVATGGDGRHDAS